MLAIKCTNTNFEEIATASRTYQQSIPIQFQSWVPVIYIILPKFFKYRNHRNQLKLKSQKEHTVKTSVVT